MDTNAYREYLQTESWKSIRLVCLSRDGHRCRVCNSDENLEVHHRSYERIGKEQVEDLTTLCSSCHELFSATSQKGRDGEAILLEHAIRESYSQMDERKCSDDVMGVVRSGFLDLDQLTAGFQNSELIILAARPSVGKTAFALNLARHIAVEERLPVVYFSLEQSRIELADRLLCCQARVDTHHIRRAQFNSDELTRILKAGEVLTDAKIYLDDAPGQSILRMAATSRRLVNEKGARLVIIDNLQAIDPGRRDHREEKWASILRQLKFLARELKVPVVVLSQMNRTSEDRQDHRPRLSDLRESGASEQVADTVIVLHRPDYHEPGQQEGLIEVIIAKQRNGPTGEVSLMYVKQYMRFENFAVEHSSNFGGI